MRIINTKPSIERGRNFTTRLSILILVATLCLWSTGPVRAEQKPNKEAAESSVDYTALSGTWLRPDGGYFLKLKDLTSKGGLKAEYFNPRRINVAKAEWRRVKGKIQVFVELRDVNYPGSTYTLLYVPKTDTLEGDYFQALEKNTYQISFVRVKE